MDLSIEYVLLMKSLSWSYIYTFIRVIFTLYFGVNNGQKSVWKHFGNNNIITLACVTRLEYVIVSFILHRSVADIDLFPAAIAERPVLGGLVGPTFACILGRQFQDIRRADRYWYENDGPLAFTPGKNYFEVFLTLTVPVTTIDALRHFETG